MIFQGGAAVRLMANDLTGEAKRKFDSYSSLGASRLRGFSSYPEAVQLLLKTFATEEVIIAAVAKFDGLSQGEKEDERAFGLRVRDTARLCGPVILSNKSFWGRVSFDEFFRRAQALGYSHRELIGKRTRTG